MKYSSRFQNCKFKIGHGKLNFIYKELTRKRPKQKT